MAVNKLNFHNMKNFIGAWYEPTYNNNVSQLTEDQICEDAGYEPEDTASLSNRPNPDEFPDDDDEEQFR